jgi:DNA-binding SARP family transcriptional activator
MGDLSLKLTGWRAATKVEPRETMGDRGARTDPSPSAPRPTRAASSDTGGQTAAGPLIVRSKVRIPRVRWLARERLDRLLDRVWQHRLTLVVAPPGSGKTTLLAEWATKTAASGVAVAWYRAESTDGDPATVLAYLQAAIAEATEGTPEETPEQAPGGPLGIAGSRAPGAAGSAAPAWLTPEQAAAALEARSPRRLLVVIDDLYALAGTPAEGVLDRLVDLAGPSVVFVVGTRTPPAFNLSRRQVSGELLSISGDDLRFRPWEVEHLFRDFYGDTLRPDELTRLARRTEGWAAGLQLFHLATRDRPAGERSRLLDGLGSSSRLTREYLTRNLLDELPEVLRSFLVDTSVLRRLSGPLCDRLIGRSGSDQVLQELERRQVFTVAVDDEGTYRYHEVLRRHLEGILVDQRGEAGARAWFAVAAELLEADGAVAEALAAYCRAEAWEAAARVLGTDGDRLADAAGSWLDTVPPAVVRSDPWLMLATARRRRADGQWARAVEAFAAAESAFGATQGGSVCRRERLALSAFLDPVPRPGADWPGRLRAAVHRDPMRQRGAPDDPDGAAGPGESLASGIAELLAGRVVDARASLRLVQESPGVDGGLAAAAALGEGLAGWLAGDPRSLDELERGAVAAETAGLTWLARLGRAGVTMARMTPEGDGLDELRSLAKTARADGDHWGATLSALAAGLGGLAIGRAAVAPLEEAVEGAHSLGATTIEVWARALEALAAARLDRPEAREIALRAESLARTSSVPGPRVAIHLALALADGDHRADHLALAESASRDTGLRPAGAAWVPPDGIRAGENAAPGAAAANPASSMGPGGLPVEIRMFGGFRVSVNGQELDLSELKPRPRAILRMLALNAGHWVHREVLAAAFWPDVDAEVASRNLHVALSGLRRTLATGRDIGGSLLVREGDAYRLLLPSGSLVDVVAVEEAISAARTAHQLGRRNAAAAGARRALELASGELLPEDGPAEWVAGRRDELAASLAEAARILANDLLTLDPDGAAEACLAGLRVDQYHDRLWRLLIEARELAGDQAAAESARNGYGRMLARLGLGKDAGSRTERVMAETGRVGTDMAPAPAGRAHAAGQGTQAPSTAVG